MKTFQKFATGFAFGVCALLLIAAATTTFDIINVTDDAYDATTWNGNLSVPTKNAVRDALVALPSGGDTLWGTNVANGVITNNSANGISLAADTQRYYFSPGGGYLGFSSSSGSVVPSGGLTVPGMFFGQWTTNYFPELTIGTNQFYNQGSVINGVGFTNANVTVSNLTVLANQTNYGRLFVGSFGSAGFTNVNATTLSTLRADGNAATMKFLEIDLISGAPTVTRDTYIDSSGWHANGFDSFGANITSSSLTVSTNVLAKGYRVDLTITAGGTTGNQTINKTAGTVNFGVGATTLTVTSDRCTTSSLIFAEVRTDDATAQIKNVVPGSGSFVIKLNAAATAETSVGFFIVNP